MLKKIFLVFVLFCTLWWISTFAEDEKSDPYKDCVYDEKVGNLSQFLTDCKSKQLAGSADYDLEQGLKTQVNTWIRNVSLILWFIAVGMLVYAGLLFQFSAGEDEKINKAKNIIKMTLLWFLLLISAGSVVYVVINVIYGLA